METEPGMSGVKMNRRRRFHLLVRKDLQLQSLKIVGGALGGMMGLVGVVGYGGVAWTIHQLPPPAAAVPWLHAVIQTVHVNLFWAGVGCVAVAAFIALWVSHQIAAPLLRIETERKRALHGAEGFLPIHARETDGLKEFTEELNRLIDQWRKERSTP
ncbi:MAG: hypothetical protein HYZ73_09430 [Elusimicrobia bacterium]|nr:hypothetical protein [Elusimicrobiota bacterium]